MFRWCVCVDLCSLRSKRYACRNMKDTYNCREVDGVEAVEAEV